MTTINQLDPSQQQVLTSLLENEQPLSVVYGPPGTGKSHLIVSLLFELATRGQSVLFVSQNTEALDVIARMIKKLESAFQLTDDELSLLDFCWILHNPEQRRLKYLKAARDRLICKSLPAVTPISEETPDNTYDLTYTDLEHIKQDALPAEIGLDEMLAALLACADDLSASGDMVKNVDSLDIRAILRLLAEYKVDDECFRHFNHPTSALRFLEPTALDITLDQCQQQAQALLTASEFVLTEQTSFAAASSQTLSQYLDDVTALLPLRPWLRLGAMQTQGLDATTLSREMTALVQAAAKIETETEKLVLPAEDEQTLFTNWPEEKFLQNASTLACRRQSVQRLRQAIKTIIDSGVAASSDWQMVFVQALGGVQATADSLVATYPALKSFDAQQLHDLDAEISAWRGRGWWGKMIGGLPPMLKKATVGASRQAVTALPTLQSELQTWQKRLTDTRLALADWLRVVNRAKKQEMALNPLHEVASEKYELVAHEAAVLETILTVDLSPAETWTGWNLARLDELAAAWQEDDKRLTALIETNKEIASRLTLTEFAAAANTIYNNRRARRLINDARGRLRAVLRLSDDRDQTLIDTALKLQALLGDGVKVHSALVRIKCDDSDQSDLQPWHALQAAVTASLANGWLSDDFYRLSAGETLSDWRLRVEQLRHFDNLQEFDALISQRRFVARLSELLGADNAANVTEFLGGDVGLSELRAKVVTDLVKAKRQSIPASKRAILPADYFTCYQAACDKQRRNYLAAGLKKLRDRTFIAAGKLKVAKNWPTANSVMEKIRANTAMIVGAYPIVIATPKEVSKYLSENSQIFDYLIFDEASQLLPGQALPAMKRANKAIIVGDPHQMPPTLTTAFGFGSKDQNEDELTNDTSILDLAIDWQIDSSYHLKVHYRSESNKLFAPSLQAIYARDGIKPIVEARSGEMPIQLLDNLGENDDANFAEVARVLRQKLHADPQFTFCLLFTRRDLKGELGFKNYLAANPDDNYEIYQLLEKQRLLISTVTNCQGIEGDHTLIYFNYYHSPLQMWFFNEQAGAYKRLNVAITRQKKSLTILMANPWSAWQQACDQAMQAANLPNRYRSASLMMALLAQAGTPVNAQTLDKQYAPQATQIVSPLTQALYERLRKYFADRLDKEVKVWANVGDLMYLGGGLPPVGGFRIEIAIYDVRRNRFVLGIETDSGIYHQGSSREFGDGGRRQTLERKEWTLYRIWSSNWLADPAGEWHRLVTTIENLLETNDKNTAE